MSNQSTRQKIHTSKRVQDDHPSSPKSPPRELSSKSPVISHSLSHLSRRALIESKLETPPQPIFCTPQPSCSATRSIRPYIPIACTIIQSITFPQKNGEDVDIPIDIGMRYGGLCESQQLQCVCELQPALEP